MQEYQRSDGRWWHRGRRSLLAKVSDAAGGSVSLRSACVVIGIHWATRKDFTKRAVFTLQSEPRKVELTRKCHGARRRSTEERLIVGIGLGMVRGRIFHTAEDRLLSPVRYKFYNIVSCATP
jgi:hypothetical protein